MAYLDYPGLQYYDGKIKEYIGEVPAQPDGNYPNMTVGNADQLTSTMYVEDSVPYLYRTSGGSKDIGDREYLEIVGGSVGWNQLCNGTSVTVQSGHKYYMVKGGTPSIGSSDGTAITELTSGTDIVTDLTLLLGSTLADYIYTLETTTAGAGIAKLKSWGFFTKDYYAYDAGSLKSVEGLESHDMVGFNQWDEEWESGYYDIADGSKKASSSWARNKELIPVVPNTVYTFKANTSETVGGIGYILFYDGSKQYINYYIQITSNICGTTGQQFTVPSNACYISFYMNVAWQSVGICINLHWDGERDGEYEPYVKHSYPLDSSLTLRGIPKLDASYNLYYDGDVYEASGTVTRNFGERPYESGDESLPDVITDGTTTIYKLETPTTETADPFQSPQIVDDFGTEEFVTDSIVPVGHATKYPANLRDKLQHLPSPTGTDGYYAIHEDGEQMTLSPLPAEIPSAPSTDGTYVLKATVSSGSVTLTWDAE